MPIGSGPVLIINRGSSSVKMALLAMPSEQLLAEGLAERLGQAQAMLTWNIEGEAYTTAFAGSECDAVIQNMLHTLLRKVDKGKIVAVGHRVVHGGEHFTKPVVFDADVLAEVGAVSHLAPLHNPANLSGVRAAMEFLPSVPHIAVFDTAFHHTIPPHAYLYAVPWHWYHEYGVRRYGFHGASHHYAGQEAAKVLGRAFNDCQLLTAHLGNGCSATAISNGRSVDTTMGFTPMEGLVMGTRSGDLDPGVHDFIARQTGCSLEEITNTLNRESGLLGLSGCSNDMRTLLEKCAAGDERATLAINVFCYRLAKALAALTVALDHVDAIVFTGGIGEHAAAIRMKTVQHLSHFGIQLDTRRNSQHGQSSHGFISKSESDFPVLVIATDEEKMIARYVYEVLHTRDNDT